MFGVSRESYEAILIEKFKDTDLDDPSTVYKIIEYYEEIDEADNEFVEEVISKQDAMIVSWSTPWYQNTTGRVARRIKPDPDRIKQYRTDRIDYDEDKQILKNWKEFRKTYNLPDRPESYARFKNGSGNRRKTSTIEQMRTIIAAHLAQGLERTLHQVYTRFVTEYAYPVKGSYSEMEKKIMEICFDHFKDKAVVVLSKVLGREVRGLNKRYRLFLGENRQQFKNTRIKWNLESATNFLKSLLQHSNAHLEELQNANIERQCWLKVQDDMDASYDHLKKFWNRKLHLQCFLEKNITLHEIRRKIYKILKSSPYKRWRDIRWYEVVKKLPKGCTAVFAHYITQSHVERIAPQYMKMKMRAILSVWKEMKHVTSNKRLLLLRADADGTLHFRENKECSESVRKNNS